MLTFIIFLAFFGIASVAFIGGNGIYEETKGNSTVPHLIILGLILFVLSLSVIIYHGNNPTALEVYEGKTELKIEGTWKDGVFTPTDSTVIYKKESYVRDICSTNQD